MMINNYNFQKGSNLLALISDQDYVERREVLFRVINQFDQEGIRYGITFSLNLFMQGIVDDFNDIDIFVAEEDIPRMIEVMKSMKASLEKMGGNGFCKSDHFFSYMVDSVQVEIMVGFRINTYGTTYYYPLNLKELDFVQIYGKKIPLVPAEALFISYFMMVEWQPRRIHKWNLLKSYLEFNGVEFQSVFVKALTTNLPKQLRNEIKRLLANQ